ncbi:putative 16S rRNA methyltransferase RsmB F [Trypanosoma vivax]|uniref:SAM-dependent MTase RsmB/NOP-type domain-containing protein n=1 Tax=Trypanosoma vivax (strain Y486) TaxID=1055687 RepID=G0U6W4_TRYVY|nr:hypothetical protein TRVL_08177 [Trypanosoma vivax]KAH8611562.1 putative 16S rRNA methyltransferase RsmB F [Trypanosoma vivax]CCC51620.1 conserved hypothetical protein [Trypanosoma vivax Y486]
MKPWIKDETEPTRAKKRKLKALSKRGHELKACTVYDENGNWMAASRQDILRQIPCPFLNEYYCNLQQLCTPKEWEEEMALFRQPLPTTIWINDTDALAPDVSRYFQSLDRSLVEPISWYPISGMAWRVNAGKTEFRRQPAMQELRQFIIQQTAAGTISRQEEVSMIPPFLLNIMPNDICLDMCASPGSKTAQMLVALGRHKVVPAGSDSSPFPFDYQSEGLVIANDIDTKRANMLVHQVKRLRLLFPFALFTNNDAQFFPNVEVSRKGSSTELRFDKILCDVVCSGDGTIRKAPHIFKIWSPREAITLQKTQIQIAMRACHLLRVGGRLVYSTCSMNPIENEAVVAQIVHRTQGAMKLVDASLLLPGLHSAPGLRKWVVTNIRGEVVTAPCEGAHEALFPPNTPGAYASEAVSNLDLRLCMRLLPSHCNGGAFFIAVLDKVSEFRFQKREGSRAVVTEDNAGVQSGIRSQGTDAYGGEVGLDEGSARSKGVPPQFVAAPSPITEVLEDFYRIKKFPTELLVVRTANGERDLNLSHGSICSIVSRSALEVLQNKTDALIVTSAGLRVFAHEHLDGGWRIASESAVLFSKLMSQSPRLVRVPVEFVGRLISSGKLKDIPLCEIEDESLRSQLQSLDVGTLLLHVNAPQAAGGTFYTVALRARKRVQLLVDREDLAGLKMRLGLTKNEAAVISEGTPS